MYITSSRFAPLSSPLGAPCPGLLIPADRIACPSSAVYYPSHSTLRLSPSVPMLLTVMRLATLAAATLGILPTLATVPGAPKSLGPCTRDLDGDSTCFDPKREFLFDDVDSLSSTRDRRDWHIGCAASGTCSYYQDDTDEHENLHHRRHWEETADTDDDFPHKRNHLSATRCKPRVHIVQYFDGANWIDFFTCPQDHRCVDIARQGICKHGLTRIVPTFPAVGGNASSRPRSERELVPLPTRCDPVTFNKVQYSDGIAWHDFHPCGPGRSCKTIDEKAGCTKGGYDHIFPEAYGPALDDAPPVPAQTTNDEPVSTPPTNNKIVSEENKIVSEENKIVSEENKIVSEETKTRCDPNDKPGRRVEQLVNGEWVPFYSCRLACEEFPDFAACRERTGKYLVPHPPPPRRSLAARAPISSHGVSSQCSPDNPEEFHVFQDGKFLLYGNCPEDSLCREVDGWAKCDTNSGQWFPERPLSLLRQDSPAPDFHTMDTRCNPRNPSEVQRFNGQTWEHHYTCTFRGSCVDVDGHGACRLKNNMHEVPAANQSSVEIGEPSNPLRVGTKCNKRNETEVLAWNGTAWASDGVCLPPYVCYDFSGTADFAICAKSGLGKDQIWLPWPSLTAPTGPTTRCKNEKVLQQFNGKKWVPYRQCKAGFHCSKLSDAPHNGGCVASSIDDVKRHLDLSRRNLVATSTADLYEPFGFERNLLKRDDSGLVDDGRAIVTQGDNLSQDGQALNDNSNALNNILNGYQSENEAESASKIRRRGEDSLIDDSDRMRSQGRELVREGNRLIKHGQRLLDAIYGDNSDDIIESIPYSRLATPEESSARQQGTEAGPEYDIDECLDCICDVPYQEDCVKTCEAQCGLELDESDHDSDNTQSDCHCEYVCDCDEGDATCWKNCAECRLPHRADAANDVAKRNNDCEYMCNCELLDVHCHGQCAACKAAEEDAA
ncbi:hypothetical protein BU26DRAFT_595217 [Trematosphaeria pertusa]|uniref:Uncharacterized protein n=1 Tax=Trematosphaeria pertusa TaxID=390896 RepID=A0A6A6IH54_9PLEO|nr:uncharacterized protein BU26DRAFT_595217 [Trematosphaeria pertusa]KAF2249368.1 hypothetical protein BU26DRAFT_595217 [Trematosphaeria pertusa]